MKSYTQTDCCCFIISFESILHMFQKAGCGSKIKHSHHFWVQEKSRQTRGVILKRDQKKIILENHTSQSLWFWGVKTNLLGNVPPCVTLTRKSPSRGQKSVRSLRSRLQTLVLPVYYAMLQSTKKKRKRRQKQEWEPCFKGAKQLINQMVSHF